MNTWPSSHCLSPSFWNAGLACFAASLCIPKKSSFTLKLSSFEPLFNLQLLCFNTVDCCMRLVIVHVVTMTHLFACLSCVAPIQADCLLINYTSVINCRRDVCRNDLPSSGPFDRPVRLKDNGSDYYHHIVITWFSHSTPSKTS